MHPDSPVTNFRFDHASSRLSSQKVPIVIYGWENLWLGELFTQSDILQ